MKAFLVFLIMATEIFAGSQASGILSVSAFVAPAARLEVQAANLVAVGVTMYPNAQALVWTAAGSCGTPENPKVILSSGIHYLSFTPEEVQGKNMVCLTSNDGVLHTSARLPQ
jgi:hypothetical protein